jgi:hypothetical protein
MRDDGGQAIFFYSRHPITAEIIRSKLRASRGNLHGLRRQAGNRRRGRRAASY